jgi:hypothetical protein
MKDSEDIDREAKLHGDVPDDPQLDGVGSGQQIEQKRTRGPAKRRAEQAPAKAPKKERPSFEHPYFGDLKIVHGAKQCYVTYSDNDPSADPGNRKLLVAISIVQARAFCASMPDLSPQTVMTLAIRQICTQAVRDGLNKEDMVGLRNSILSGLVPLQMIEMD